MSGCAKHGKNNYKIASNMSLKRWYTIMLFLPLIVPLPTGALVLMLTGYAFGNEYGPWPAIQWRVPNTSFLMALLLMINGVILMGMVWAGMQYLLFASWVLKKYRKQGAQRLAKLSWRLPVMFFAVWAVSIFIIAAVYSLINPNFQNDFWMAFLVCVVGGFYLFFVSYSYVLFVHSLTWLVRRIGWIAD